MKRSTPLRRRKRLTPKRSRPRRSGRVGNPEFMAWIRTLPCILEGGECSGRVHAHHAGPRPFGRKAADDTCIPLCQRHHSDLHDGRGYFKSTGLRGWLRLWQDARIRDYQAAWVLRQGGTS